MIIKSCLLTILLNFCKTQSAVLEFFEINLNISSFQLLYNCSNSTLSIPYDCIVSINQYQYDTPSNETHIMIDLKVIKQDSGCLIQYNSSGGGPNLQIYAWLVVLKLDSSFKLVHFQKEGNIRNQDTFQYPNPRWYQNAFFLAGGWDIDINGTFNTSISVSNQTNSMVILTIFQQITVNQQLLQGCIILYNGSQFNINQIDYSGHQQQLASPNIGISVKAQNSTTNNQAVFVGYHSYNPDYNQQFLFTGIYFSPKIYSLYCTIPQSYCGYVFDSSPSLAQYNSYNSTPFINYTLNTLDNTSNNTLNSTPSINSLNNTQTNQSNSTSNQSQKINNLSDFNSTPIKNSIQSTIIQSQGSVTLQLIITRDQNETSQEIQSYIYSIKENVEPQKVQSRTTISSSIQGNQITYNITISGSIQNAMITVRDNNNQLLQQTLSMIPGYSSKSSIVQQQQKISDSIQANKTIFQTIINNLRYSAVFTLLANNPQQIAHYLLIQVQVPEHVWECQRIIAIFIWKTIPSFNERFNQGTIQNYKLFGVDVNEQMETSQSDYLPFHVLMISNYFLVNVQIQAAILIVIILVTIGLKYSYNKNQVQQGLARRFLTNELKDVVSMQLICQALEAFTIQFLCSSLFQLMQNPFQKQVTVLSVISFATGILCSVFYLLVYIHQFQVSNKVRQHINIVIRCQKQLSIEEIQYYRNKYSFDLCDNDLNKSLLIFHFHYIMVIKKLLFALTTIVLFGHPFTQLIILAIIQIGSLSLTIILRPYSLQYQQVLRITSNLLLSIALIYRILLQQIVEDSKNGSNDENQDFSDWDQKGWVVVYCEISAVFLECSLTLIKIICSIYGIIQKMLNKKKQTSQLLMQEQVQNVIELQNQESINQEIITQKESINQEIITQKELFNQQDIPQIELINQQDISQIELMNQQDIPQIEFQQFENEENYTSEQINKMIRDLYNKVKAGLADTVI